MKTCILRQLKYFNPLSGQLSPVTFASQRSPRSTTDQLSTSTTEHASSQDTSLTNQSRFTLPANSLKDQTMLKTRKQKKFNAAPLLVRYTIPVHVPKVVLNLKGVEQKTEKTERYKELRRRCRTLRSSRLCRNESIYWALKGSK